MSNIAKGRAQFLQRNIIESMYQCYKRMGWNTWRYVFRELLEDPTIREKLKTRGLHVTEDNFRQG